MNFLHVQVRCSALPIHHRHGMCILITCQLLHKLPSKLRENRSKQTSSTPTSPRWSDKRQTDLWATAGDLRDITVVNTSLFLKWDIYIYTNRVRSKAENSYMPVFPSFSPPNIIAGFHPRTDSAKTIMPFGLIGVITWGERGNIVLAVGSCYQTVHQDLCRAQPGSPTTWNDSLHTTKGNQQPLLMAPQTNSSTF